MNHTLVVVGLPVFAYLLGSIPWGVLLTRRFAAADIRKQGSGNIGATNVYRVAGPVPGALTLIGDILKGVIPVYLASAAARADNGASEIFVASVVLAAFFGHLYPLFMKFKDGGKGVATAAGCFAVLAPLASIAAVAAFGVGLAASRRVSVGSLGAAVVLSPAIWFATGSAPVTAAAGVIALFIFIRHAENIRRLVSGTEPAARLGRRNGRIGKKTGDG